MKRTVIFFSTLFCLNLCFSQSKSSEHLLGVINKDRLIKTPYKEWFEENYSKYVVNEKLINTYKKTLKNYSIKVFLGTWCGDSKREVPRFFKVLERANFPMKQLKVIAVSRSKEAYKQSPTGEEKGLNIHRVPTFIFYKNEKEMNRIVEYPKATFEHDINAIIQEKYVSNYSAANYLNNLIKTEGMPFLNDNEDQLVQRLAEHVKGSRELNTLGYVELRAGNLKNAIAIFKINSKIFPYKPNVYDSLGEAYFEAGNYNKALKNYYKVLSLKPNNEDAFEMIATIKEAMVKN